MQLLKPLTFYLFLFSFLPVFSCKVPVFRYALEQWSPGIFSCYVLHSGMDAKTREALDALRSATANQTPCNILPIPVDIKKKNHVPEIRSLIEKHAHDKLPLLVIHWPQECSHPGEALSEPLTLDLVHRITTSPSASELVWRLMNGETAVWLLLKSGNATKDSILETVLNEEFIKLKSKLKLPVISDEERPAWFDESKGPRLRIDFSIIKIDRTDPYDAFFIKLLLAGCPEAEKSSEPFAFPVFGQGRCMGGFSAKQLTPPSIEQISSFITGECSCEIKELNPGFDLIISNDWRNLKPDPNTPKTEATVPKLSGMSSIHASEPPSAPQTGRSFSTSSPPAEKESSKLSRVLGTILALLIIGVVTGGFILRSRKK